MSWLITSGQMNPTTAPAPAPTGFNVYDPTINKGRPEFIGKPGYERALAAGYTNDEINNAIANQGVKTGPNSGYSTPSFDASNTAYNKGRVEVFGNPAYQRATAAGFSDEQIQAGIDAAGVQRGRNVPGFTPRERPAFDATNSKINRGKLEVFGMPAYNRATKVGYTPEEINAGLDAAGVKVGKRASSALGRPNPRAEAFDQMLQGF